MSAEIASAMSSARDLINAHLYPVLATFSVIYFAIQRLQWRSKRAASTLR